MPWGACKNKGYISARESTTILHIHQQTSNRVTYIDHGIRGDSEQRGPLCDLSDLLPHVPSDTNPLQFRQRPACANKIIK